ncbi:MAG: hypothetical protein ACREFU_05420 [Acetobacteraceae bacterium]
MRMAIPPPMIGCDEIDYQRRAVDAMDEERAAPTGERALTQASIVGVQTGFAQPIAWWRPPDLAA